MKLLFLIPIFLLSFIAKSQSEKIFIYKQDVDSLVKWVKNKDVNKIADKVIYPLDRKYPLPDIHNRKEFIAYYDTLFDDSISTIITTSTNIDNWINMKHEGVKLNSGIIWFSGNLSISVFNYYSTTELNKRQNLINEDKNSIHENLRDYKEPIMKFKTQKLNVRIDLMKDNSYRYCVWNLTDSTYYNPRMIIHNGIEVPGFSKLCPFYQFKSNEYTYDIIAGCQVSGYNMKNLSPEDTGFISIKKNRQEIKTEKIIELNR